jgi:hypothetical protein
MSDNNGFLVDGSSADYDAFFQIWEELRRPKFVDN